VDDKPSYLDSPFYPHIAIQTSLASALRDTLLERLELVVLSHLITQRNVLPFGIETEVAAGTVLRRAFE
jgi:hypothetical protein